MTTYEDTLTLNCSPDEAFEFLIRSVNIAALTPPVIGLSLVDAPDRLELGSRLEFEANAYGMKQKIVHEIVEFAQSHRFVEQQVHGPLKFYQHEHVVHRQDDGGVLLIDRVQFRPPGGLTGLVLTEARIVTGLQHAFQHRYRELKKRLEPAG